MTHSEAVHLCHRARKIALRIAPRPTGTCAHGFYETAAFIAQCQQEALHNATYRRIFHRLADKQVTAKVEREIRFTMTLKEKAA